MTFSPPISQRRTVDDNFIDKQGDSSEHAHIGVATIGPVRVQTKSGVAPYNIAQ